MAAILRMFWNTWHSHTKYCVFWYLIPLGPIDNKSTLVHLMACCRTGNKPLRSLPTHTCTCVTRSQCVQWARSLWQVYVIDYKHGSRYVCFVVIRDPHFQDDIHDDVINGTIFRVTGPLCGEFTGHRWIPRTKSSGEELWCLFICAWTNVDRESGDLRRHYTHYDVTVMTGSRLIIPPDHWQWKQTRALFTKPMDVLPQDLVKSRSREIHV